jgi:hypothetical protein
MQAEGHFATVTRNPLAQFGVPARSYLGATLLPEQTVTENAYREEAVRYLTIVANDGTRYSPVQKKGQQLLGEFLVELGDSDIGSDITARDYEALLNLIEGGSDMQAMERIVDWSDTVLNRALVEHNERQRWQCIVNAEVQRRGDNGYRENVAYSNPTGHRSNATDLWSDDDFDPFDDIDAKVELLASKGLTVTRIVSSTPVVSIMMRNAKVQARAGLPVINAVGVIEVARQRASLAAINSALAENDLPPIEKYDLQFRTQNGSGYFLVRNVMVFVCTTGRDANIDLGDGERFLPNVLGYHAVGKATGQPGPGRVIRVESFTNKPPRIEGEAWQTSLPVILDPESIGVIAAIA